MLPLGRTGVFFLTGLKNTFFASLWNLRAMESVYSHINKITVLRSAFGLKEAGVWHLDNKGISIDGDSLQNTEILTDLVY